MIGAIGILRVSVALSLPETVAVRTGTVQPLSRAELFGGAPVMDEGATSVGSIGCLVCNEILRAAHQTECPRFCGRATSRER